MIVEALIERLDEPSHDGHIYITRCITDAITNNKFVQERILNESQDTVGRIIKYYIKDNCLYALVDIKDGIFTEKDRLYMGGIGTLTLDINGDVVDDCKFGIVHSYEVDREKEE